VEDIPRWAAEAERLGFLSLGAIDRLVYDCVDPLIALSAAATATTSVELFTTVLCVGWRNNSLLLAKQLAAVGQISGGRFTAGLGLGGWDDDFTLTGVPLTGRGPEFDRTLEIMRDSWSGQVRGAQAAMPALPDGGPRVMIGGTAEASFARAARCGEGWVAPGFGRDALFAGIAGVRDAWTRAGRSGRPRILVERYFSLGPDSGAVSDRYLEKYFDGVPEYGRMLRIDLLDDADRVASEIAVLAEAGCDDLVLLPCGSSWDQLGLMADALEKAGARQENGFEIEVAP